MQNHLETSSKTQFWTQNVRNLTKTRDLVMSGPVQEDKYLLQTSGNNFIFSEITPFHISSANLFVYKSFVLLSKVIVFIKSSVLVRENVSFSYKVIGFTKRIYHYL